MMIFINQIHLCITSEVAICHPERSEGSHPNNEIPR